MIFFSNYEILNIHQLQSISVLVTRRRDAIACENKPDLVNSLSLWIVQLVDWLVVGSVMSYKPSIIFVFHFTAYK